MDGSGNASCAWPIDGNDTKGDCGSAMAAHVDNTWTYGQGKAGFSESAFSETAIVNQYLSVSGGDNGLDEEMVTVDIWGQGKGIAGNSAAVIGDHLDVDVTGVALTNYLIDQFYSVCMAWSVPDDFVNDFETGAVFSGKNTPDPANGHYVPLIDIAAGTETSNGKAVPAGSKRIVTWGGWCWADDAFIGSVQPQCFVAFSARQFNSLGYDSKGRHVSTQAAVWVAIGGSASKAAAVVAMFPGVTPAPSPIPTPVPADTDPADASTGAADSCDVPRLRRFADGRTGRSSSVRRPRYRPPRRATRSAASRTGILGSAVCRNSAP